MTHVYRKVVETPEHIKVVSDKIQELIQKDDGRVLVQCDSYYTYSQQLYWMVLKNYFAVAVLRRKATHAEVDELGEMLKVEADLVHEFEYQGIKCKYPKSLTTLRSKKAMRLFLDRVTEVLHDVHGIEVPTRDDYMVLTAEMGASEASKILEQQFILKLSTVPPVKLLAQV